MDEAEQLAYLASENELLTEFLYVCPVGLIRFDASGQVELMNPAAAQLLLPIAPEGALEDVFEALASCAPDLRQLVADYEAPHGRVVDHRRLLISDGDDLAPEVISLTVVKLDSARFMAVVSNVSQQVAQERRLKQAETWCSAIMSGVNDYALLSLDRYGRIDSWNASGLRQTGFAEKETLGRTLNLLYLPEDAIQGRALEQVEHASRDGWHIDEGWRRRKDGARYWCQSMVSALREDDGLVVGFSVVLRDVTEGKVSGDELRRLLITDHLTGVANRARFFELAEAEEARWKRFGKPLSALMIDADHFKRVNDVHGHATGDAVLKAIGQTCAALVRSTDIVARLGGEEFGILLPGLDLDTARLAAERLRQAIDAITVESHGQRISCTVSIGCATMGGEIVSIRGLLHSADQALYDAKRSGRNQVVTAGPPSSVSHAA